MALATTTVPRQSDEEIRAELDHAYEQESFGVKVNLWFLREGDGQPVRVEHARVVDIDTDRDLVWLADGRGSRISVVPANIIWVQAVDQFGRRVSSV